MGTHVPFTEGFYVPLTVHGAFRFYLFLFILAGKLKYVIMICFVLINERTWPGSVMHPESRTAGQGTSHTSCHLV